MLKERLFRLGVDPRVVSSANGHTLLHAACGFGAPKIAKLVVRRAVYESHPPFRAFRTNARTTGPPRWTSPRTPASSGSRSGSPRWARRAVSEARLTPDHRARRRPSAAAHERDDGPGALSAGVLPAGVRTGARRGRDPGIPPSVTSQCDAYLFGALESVLGDLEGDESDESDESARLPRDALHNQTRERDDRARARRR